MGNRYAAVSPYDGFNCKDGVVIIACGNQKLFAKLCNEILEMPQLVEDPRFTDMPGRLENQDDLKVLIEDWLADKTMEQATDILLSHGIPAGPILDISQILANPHVKEREMFVEMEHPTLGRITVNGCAIKLMDTPGSVRKPAPALGQDNGAILSSLGYTQQEIDQMSADGVI